MPDTSGPDLTAEELLLADVVLRIADRDERLFGSDAVRTEVLLTNAGLSLPAVAHLTGKNYETVKTAVRRARLTKTKRRKNT
jgi:hypothetical protein